MVIIPEILYHNCDHRTITNLQKILFNHQNKEFSTISLCILSHLRQTHIGRNESAPGMDEEPGA